MSDPSEPEIDARDRKGARAGSPPPEPGLYVVATPIGNLRDITLRALDILAGASRVYAEDTRVTRKLLDAYGLKPRLASYHEHNAEAARAEILAALAAGESVALVSDAGTPLVSDPGFKLARAVIEAGHRVFPIPGASAPIAALVASGLPSDRFLFAGFAPAKEAARRSAFEDLVELEASLLFFETGPRLAESLAEMAAVFGPRPAAVMRELTKLHEEARRDTLDALAAHYALAGAPKGEIVVVVGPPLAAAEVDDAALDEFLRVALTRGSVKEAAAQAHEALSVPRKRAYARALALKDGA
ncbi:MAG: 16S rRNA (cytidine(1402)-2'-O)-methyltransferase [Hyphomonadaceae bacterium]|nr:16S rRNA (cytidine(1402)-2'-O)-methyltransferase [Hyphomonadaceae bacterium]